MMTSSPFMQKCLHPCPCLESNSRNCVHQKSFLKVQKCSTFTVESATPYKTWPGPTGWLYAWTAGSTFWPTGHSCIRYIRVNFSIRPSTKVPGRNGPTWRPLKALSKSQFVPQFPPGHSGFYPGFLFSDNKHAVSKLSPVKMIFFVKLSRIFAQKWSIISQKLVQSLTLSSRLSVVNSQ